MLKTKKVSFFFSDDDCSDCHWLSLKAMIKIDIETAILLSLLFRVNICEIKITKCNNK